MVYVCDKCHFEFERMSPDVEQCPDCGKQFCVRPATQAEAAAYESRKQELDKESL